MHRAGRGGGEVVEDEVAVGGAVDRVGADVLEAEVVGDRAAVDLPVDAGQRPGAERHHAGAVERELEAQHVAGEHPEVGEQVVAEVDGLGALQVGVAGHRPVAVAPRRARAAAPSPRRRARSPAASAPGRPSPRRSRPGRCGSGRCGACRRAGRSPRRAGARSPCGCPRRPRRTRSRARPSAPRTRSRPASISLELLVVEDADSAQAPGVRLRLVDVVGRQPPVELDRAVEPPEARVGVFAEAGHQVGCRRFGESLAHPRRPGPRSSTGRRAAPGSGRDASSATGNWPSR